MPGRPYEAGSSAENRLALTNDLGVAVARNELTLDYQPIVQTRNRKIVGFEALVRWRHPKLGLIPPDLFIPAAEGSGLIFGIGEWVLQEACREAATWPQDFRMSVNVSPVQLNNRGFSTLVAGILMRTGFSPKRLELEITETALAEDFSQAISILSQLKALGIQIAMDDFGTGFSNLSLLQSFSFDAIKIDGCFISNLHHLPQTAAIVRAMINLARAVGARVTAERVETEEQFSFLAREKCDEVQGYLLGLPKPISAYRDAMGIRQPSNVAVFAR